MIVRIRVHLTDEERRAIAFHGGENRLATRTECRQHINAIINGDIEDLISTLNAQDENADEEGAQDDFDLEKP